MTQGEPVAVEFELTPEEWIEAQAVHLESLPMVTRAIRTVQGLFLAITVLLGVLELLQGQALLAGLSVALGLAVTPFLPALMRHSQRRQLTKVATRGLAHGTFGPHRLELREEGMLDVTSGYEWLTRWEAIDRVEQAENLFLIYTGPQAYLPVPVSAFPDSAALREFSDAFFARVGEADQRRALPEPGGDSAGDPSDDGLTGSPERPRR